MKNKIWFKAKTKGYGWYPATIEGWFVMLIWTLTFILINFFFLQSLPWYFFFTFISIAILFFISYQKGEKLKWRWGK